MKLIGNLFKNHDWLLTLLSLGLLITGSITIYSVTFNTDPGFIWKHISIVAIGYVIYFFIAGTNYKWLKEPKVVSLIYILTVGLLVYVKLFAGEVAETNRWIQLGPVNIQPAEIAKITIILLTATILGFAKNTLGFQRVWLQSTKNTLRHIEDVKLTREFVIKLAVMTALVLPILILILVQPSFGNTIITFTIWILLVSIFFPDRSKLILYLTTFSGAFLTSLALTLDDLTWTRLILITIAAGVIISSILAKKLRFQEIIMVLLAGFLMIPAISYGWNNVLKDYQQERVEIFLDPSSDPQGSGWQVRQSLIAVGSGRLFGKGYMNGTQSTLQILPYPHTDFIFAAFAEQFGYVGSLILTLVLFAVPARLFKLTEEVDDLFDRAVIWGVGILFLVHIIVNIGMNLGILPVTGVPLPLVSYGGSSIIVNLIGLALVQNILKHTRLKYNSEKLL